MFSIPNPTVASTSSRDFSRREMLRIGGSAFLGLNLAQLLAAEAKAATSEYSTTQTNKPDYKRATGRGAGRAKNLILLYLQGGPSHLDLWDPKPEAPSEIRSVFKPIATKIPGIQFSELLPQLAKVNDLFTQIRSMSYTPKGLFNHTAAVYQMLTGYTADKVSAAGQLEPPNGKDFPNFGSQIIRYRPTESASLPFVMLPRPLQESNIIGKAGSAGFLGKEFEPFTLYPPGEDTDLTKMNSVSVPELRLRPELTPGRLTRRVKLRELLSQQMPELKRQTENLKISENYRRATELILSNKVRKAFDLSQESDKLREAYGRNTFGQSCLLARRLIEADTRVVEVMWPHSANGETDHSWDMHLDLTRRIKNQAAPMLDTALSTLLTDLEGRGLLKETLVVAVGEFGRSPQRGKSSSGNENSADGRDHWPYCFSAILAGGGTKRGFVYGKSDATGSSPLENPVHPRELLATIYHAFGIDAETLVYNHLNQPRELVKGTPVTQIFS